LEGSWFERQNVCETPFQPIAGHDSTLVIPSYVEAVIKRITIPGQFGQKFERLYLNRINLGVEMCHPSDDRKHKIGGLWSRPAWVKSKTSISKITRTQKAGGVAQGVEFLSSKCKALTSNPSTCKKRKKQNKKNCIQLSKL
jgi:hypothetical protein